MRPALADQWPLDPGVTFLNHGSFGSCPRAVLAFQHGLRDRMEAQPVQFFMRDLEPMLDAARQRLAGFLSTSPETLAFVPNATTGVNTALAAMAPSIGAGDELLTTDHEYNACANALRFTAERAGAAVVVAPVPYPLKSKGEVIDALRRHTTHRTKVLLLDWVTSPTAVVLPVEEIVAEWSARGVEVLLDAAHVPGMLPMDLDALGRAGLKWCTGNLHKWVCAPKGAGFLWVREDQQGKTRPLVISHGANAWRTDRSRYRLEFDWTGTDDPTAWLSVPTAMDTIGAMLEGGWDAVRAANHALALRGREILCEALGAEVTCPGSMVGSMAAVVLPRARSCKWDAWATQGRLVREWAIEVPVNPWPTEDDRLVRVSAQLYNHEGEYRRLAEALVALREEEHA